VLMKWPRLAGYRAAQGRQALLGLSLLLSWTWDRVVTDCHGGPETVSHYYYQATVRIEVPINCPPGQGRSIDTCFVLLPGTPMPFGPNIGDPGTGTTVVSWVDPVADPDILPNPPLGGFVAWPWPTPDNPNPVISVDLAGNHCDQGCPQGNASEPIP
jgi:hypothetical protein